MLIYGVGLVIVLLSCCGLVLDLGLYESTRLKMQNAADAAAIGAVLARENGGQISAGLLEASQNGFTNGVSGVSITLQNPPQSGAYLNSRDSVQATITKTVSGIFLPNSFTLKATATAFGIPAPCVYLMNTSSAQTTLQAVNETIQSTCPSYIGYNYTFNGGSSDTGSQFYVTTPSGVSSGVVTPTPIFGAPPMADPLSYLPAPTLTGCDFYSKKVTSADTLQPGNYCGGLTINTTAPVTLKPGFYAIFGALSITGPPLQGAGVTFYISNGQGYTAGPTTIQNVNSTLSAPTTGTYQGILYFSDRTLNPGQANLSMQNWNPGSITDGIFYLPGQELLLSNLTLKPVNYLGFVADYVSIHNTVFNPSANYGTLANGSPFHPVGGGAGLVE